MDALLAQIDVQSLLAVAIIGIIAGALARFLVPGKQSMNLIFTMLLGIVGAYVGSFIKVRAQIGDDGLVWTIGWATAGAVVVLWVVMILQKAFAK